MAKVIAESDAVVTTAAVPGKKAPILITEDMVKGMAPGSVVVDIAAEHGGNCELTKPGETITSHGVKIFGPLNIPATKPYHASQMYAKNLQTFVHNLVKDGKIDLRADDEIIQDTMLTRDGKVVNARVLELLGKSPSGGGERSDA